MDHSILCGYRGKEEQDLAFATGHSRLKWGESAHNATPSRAVDVAPVPLDWDDIQSFKEFAVIVKEQAARLGLEVKWGGDYVHFKDWDHWEVS